MYMSIYYWLVLGSVEDDPWPSFFFSSSSSSSSSLSAQVDSCAVGSYVPHTICCLYTHTEWYTTTCTHIRISISFTQCATTACTGWHKRQTIVNKNQKTHCIPNSLFMAIIVTAIRAVHMYWCEPTYFVKQWLVHWLIFSFQLLNLFIKLGLQIYLVHLKIL